MKNTFKKSNIIYVFRHGETDWNREGRLQGHLEVPINMRGVTSVKIFSVSFKTSRNRSFIW
ncbi:histidine phosphatase superfamily (branch 1) domain protein [Leptospira interrogans serovar Bataviae str. HAI135]|nr:histidine phosphatase superfamily (branch 1) domain protein [Leptospira interrogans serovar Bataviae str. HAI135]